MKTNLLIADLSDAEVLTSGRPFDGIAAGRFTDMYGRTFEIKAGDLDEIVENTRAAIESSKTESGELVGLPVDAHDHDKGDGAGWLVAVERAGDVIRLTANWTAIGVELIEGKIRRLFSATIDIANKVILGGTLTNWPAVRSESGEMLLRPIELAAARGLYELKVESLDARLNRIHSAFAEQFGTMSTESPFGSWLAEVFDDYAIAHVGDVLYRVTYELADDAVTFAARDAWVEVERAYVDVMRRFWRSALELISSPFSRPAGGSRGAAGTHVSDNGGSIMTVILGELSAEDRQTLVADATAALAKELGIVDATDPASMPISG